MASSTGGVSIAPRRLPSSLCAEERTNGAGIPLTPSLRGWDTRLIQVRRDGSEALALPVKLPGNLHCLSRGDYWPPQAHTFSPLDGECVLRSLADEPALELSEGCRDVRHHLAA